MKRRSTKHKKAILDAFEDNHLLSASDVAQLVSGANESTIYRNLKRLESDGVIESMQASGEKKYELAEKHAAHDHFICNNCEDIKAVYLDEVDLGDKLPTESGFSVTVRGVCDNCK